MVEGGGRKGYFAYKIMRQAIKTFLLIALEYSEEKISFFTILPIFALLFVIFLF
jgi:hypothetical protein